MKIYIEEDQNSCHKLYKKTSSDPEIVIFSTRIPLKKRVLVLEESINNDYFFLRDTAILLRHHIGCSTLFHQEEIVYADSSFHLAVYSLNCSHASTLKPSNTNSIHRQSSVACHTAHFATVPSQYHFFCSC